MNLDLNIRKALKSQYHAALEMMRRCITQCPDDLWLDGNHVNPYWRIVYHTLYYFHLYLHQDLEDHKPWMHHRKGAQSMTLDSDIEVVPYTKAQMLDFVSFCDGFVDNQVDGLDLTRGDCGFHWYQVPKVEHLMVNLRHLQHHVAQLQDRLRAHSSVGIGWVRAQGQERT